MRESRHAEPRNHGAKLDRRDTSLGLCMMCLGIAFIMADGQNLGVSLVAVILILGGALLMATATTRGEKDGHDRREASLENVLGRSGDVLATLQDIAGHGQGDFQDLPELLRRAGVLEWKNAPKLGVSKLANNGRWFLSTREGALDEDSYDRLVGIEAALNVYEDLRAPHAAPIGDLSEQVRLDLARVALLAPPKSVPRDEESLLKGSRPGGEWECRAGVASFVEGVPAPFRVMSQMQANMELGLVCVDLELPRPASMGVAAPEEQGRVQAARAYALRSTLLVARGTFERADGARLVTVNGHEHERTRTLLSLSLTRDDLGRVLALTRDDAAFADGMPQDPCLRSRSRADGWLAEVTPFLRRSDEVMRPSGLRRPVELDDSPATEAVMRTSGAKLVSDLAIDEKAGRADAWNRLSKELGSTTEDAVSKLMALRRSTSDMTVAEACGRTSAALVEGTLDVTDRTELEHLFVDGSALCRRLEQAGRVLKADPTPEALMRVLADLECELGTIAQAGIYLDGGNVAYRYFNSTADRIHYNLHANDGGRRVCLVPDEYYVAHKTAMQILNMLEMPDEALVHAEELIRLSPLAPDSALCKARCLERQSRIFEAVNLLASAIESAATAGEMAVCYYRLAFLEWRLDRGEAATACYQQAMRLGNTEIAIVSARELHELLKKDEAAKPLSSPDEVSRALERAGVPARDAQDLRQGTLDAAIACTDAGIFAVSRTLVGVLQEFEHNDVLADIGASLA